MFMYSINYKALYAYAVNLKIVLFCPAKIISKNQSNEPPSDQTSTEETLCIEENTKKSPSCSQQLFRIIFAGDNSSIAFYICLPVATILIFIAGIVCSLTTELPYMNTGMFVFNSSVIHHSL